MHRVYMMSGGVNSWAAAKLDVQRHGYGTGYFLFADTLVEHADTYRFLIDCIANILGQRRPAALGDLLDTIPPVTKATLPDRKQHLAGLSVQAMAAFPRLVWLADGRTPFEVYHDERFLGNSRVDPCSKILKRQLLDRYYDSQYPRPTTRLVVGLGYWERGRFEGRIVKGKRKPGLRERMAERGWTFEAPLIEAKLAKLEVFDWARRECLELSDSYADGFDHDNCGGFCCKAGQRQMRLLLSTRPDYFAYCEQEEQSVRQFINRDDVSILKSGTLKEFRESGACVTLFDGQGCSCFAGDEED